MVPPPPLAAIMVHDVRDPGSRRNSRCGATLPLRVTEDALRSPKEDGPHAKTTCICVCKSANTNTATRHCQLVILNLHSCSSVGKSGCVLHAQEEEDEERINDRQLGRAWKIPV